MVSAMGFALSGCPINGGTKYTVGGTVTGLSGTGLVLQINGSHDLTFGANGSFVFGDRLANNAAYSVTVKTQPSNPSQTCTVQAEVSSGSLVRYSRARGGVYHLLVHVR